MDIGEIPVFNALRDKMSFLAARQRVLSENVANASTPGFVPRDMNTKSFDSALAAQLDMAGTGVHMIRTSSGHMDLTTSKDLSGNYRSEVSPDSDVTMDGNAVVLEDQMLKVSRTRGDYETMVAIYQRAMSMLQTAVKVASR
ncbi:MAG: flagellar basal body protein [Caulobacterales bacterium]